jgi:hypothetical protein
MNCLKMYLSVLAIAAAADVVRAADPLPAYTVTLYGDPKRDMHLSGIIDGHPVGHMMDNARFHPVTWKDPQTPLLSAVPKQQLYWTFQVMAADDQAFVSTAVTSPSRDGFLAIWPKSGQAPKLVPLKGYSLLRPYDICGSQIVGYADPSSGGQSRINCFLYTGSTFIRLDPQEPNRGQVLTTDGTHQYGWSTLKGDNQHHPAMWNSSASNPVDFLPPGKTAGAILHARGTFKVGDVDRHAALWTGAASTYRDLHPAGFDSSGAAATNGKVVVGSASLPAPQTLLAQRRPASSSASATSATPTIRSHAIVWLDGRATDLHPFLPAGYTSSTAGHVDAAGNILGSASDGKDSRFVVWSPAAQPATSRP